VVVGAGPAGSAAAWHLATAGHPVLLVDKARFPRDKSCGDGLTGGAIAELARMGLRPNDVKGCQWIDRTSFVSPSGRPVGLSTGGDGIGPWLGAVSREELDKQLLDRARAAGAVVVEGDRVDAVRAVSNGVEVDLEGGTTFRPEAVIAADGAWSSVRRSIEGSAAQLSKWQASRVYVDRVEGPGANQAFVWFDADLLPGYAWSFPLGGGRANVGVGALRGAGGGGAWIVRRTERLLEEAATVLGAAARPSGRPLVWPIPTDLRRSRLTALDGRVLFVGDAAGATDPMTGEGIAEALMTGRLAAAAVASGRPGDYARLAWRALGGRHRRRSRCSRLLSRPPIASLGLAVADLSPWTRRQFAGWVFR